MKIAICFLSIKENHFNYNLLKEQCDNSKLHKIDIFYYINDNNINYKRSKEYIYFNYNYLKHKYKYYHDFLDAYKYSSYYGLTFLTWLDMYSEHKNEYDMYLFYEDDICYFGDNNFFDLIDFNTDVLLQDCVNLYKNDTTWYWYNEGPYNILNSYDIYHCIMNIYGAKQKVIEGFLDFINKNYIHDEALLPTYVLNNEFFVNYINDYIPLYSNYIDNINNIKSQNFNLIHPIKTKDQYMRIKALR